MGTIGFPDYFLERATITPMAVVSADALRSVSFTASGAVAWAVLNLGLFIPFTTNEIVSIGTLTAVGGNTGGTLDLGIYTAAGGRLVSLGSGQVAGANNTFRATISTTVLGPGRYYLAASCPATANIIAMASVSGIYMDYFGMMEMAASYPLPATVILGASVSRGYMPLIGAALKVT